MTEFTTKPSTEVFPVGTPITELVGKQCHVSAYRMGSMRRCTNESSVVMVVQCEACKQGGMVPMCAGHGKQIAERAAEKDATCPECGSSSMNQTEPVEFPKPKQQVAAPERVPLDNDFGEMDW